MSNPVISAVKGVLASAQLLVGTFVLFFGLMVPVALVKLLVPIKPVRKVADVLLNFIAETWIQNNNLWVRWANRKPWHLPDASHLSRKGWYLVSCNHQSWADILVLQRVFNRRIPMLKFFIKHELIYVPILGLAWWALDFPFMRRKGGASVAQDLAVARKACEKFRVIPTSVISFLEGTRYTQAKHDKQKSPYKHLLRPKTGGIAMALETLGDQFDALLDVTIVYPKGVPEFHHLLLGQVDDVIVTFREVPIPKSLQMPEDSTASAYRAELQAWMGEMWARKDAEISELLAKHR
ncbi:MAG: acyltransferase [Pseudomonadota bacterium]